MAESADFNNSAQYVNFNVTNLDRDAFIFHKYNLNLSYDGIRLKWNNTFKELQEFFQNTVGLNGKWISPGGSSKRYIDADFDLIANWYPGKQNSLLFQGKDGSLLRESLINLFTQVAVLNCPDKTQSQPDNIDIESRSLSTSFVEGICDYTNDVDTPKAKKDAISVADVSSIEELEHFIDNSYQNMSVLNTDHYTLKSTPLRLSTNNNSSAMEIRISKIENRIECEVEKLLARISEQDQIIDANKQEVHRLSSENLHLKSRILNLEEMIISQDKISIKKASVEKSNKNECTIIENECILIDDHIYNNPGSDITIQAVNPNTVISEVVAQNEYSNIDKLNTINASENGATLKNSAPENLGKAPYVYGNNSVQIQPQNSDILNTVSYVNKKKDCNNKFNRYLHQQHFYQNNNQSIYDSDQNQPIPVHISIRKRTRKVGIKHNSKRNNYKRNGSVYGINNTSKIYEQLKNRNSNNARNNEDFRTKSWGRDKIGWFRFYY